MSLAFTEDLKSRLLPVAEIEDLDFNSVSPIEAVEEAKLTNEASFIRKLVVESIVKTDETNEMPD